MTSELKPCPKCNSDRVTCWNVTGGNQIVCKDCGLRNKPDPDEAIVRNDWNTRATPSADTVTPSSGCVFKDLGIEKTSADALAGLVPVANGVFANGNMVGFVGLEGFEFKLTTDIRERHPVVRYDQAAAVVAAKDAEIERLRSCAQSMVSAFDPNNELKSPEQFNAWSSLKAALNIEASND